MKHLIYSFLKSVAKAGCSQFQTKTPVFKDSTITIFTPNLDSHLFSQAPYTTTVSINPNGFDDYFEEVVGPNTQNCAITCQLMDSTCSGPYPGSILSLSPSNQIQFTNGLSDKTDLNFGFYCSNTGYDICASNQYFAVRDYCNSANIYLVLTSPTVNTISYDPSVSKIALGQSDGQLDFFKDIANYGLTAFDNYCALAMKSCLVLKDDCSTTFTDTSHIWFNPTKPLTLYAATNIAAGYDHTVCVKCCHSYYCFISGTTNTYRVIMPGCSSTLSAGTASPVTLSFNDDGSNITPSGSWDSFFSNSDTTNCPITSCSLHDAGSCGGALSGSYISIGPSTPFTLAAVTNVNSGYTKSVCIRCANAGQQIDLDNLSITQGIDCSATLSTPSVENVALDYLGGEAGGSPSVTIKPSSSFTSFDSWFQNTETVNCPITSCTLWDSGTCGSSFTGSSFLNMGASAPWAITAQQDVTAGYSFDVCIRCSNGQQNVDVRPWQITQKLDCQGTLTANTPRSWSIVYSSGAAMQTIINGDWNTFFTNTKPTDCPITACSISDSGNCGGSFSGTGVSFQSISPWIVQASKTIPSGYSTSFCIRCSNNGQSNVETDGFQVTQVKDCTSALSSPSPTSVNLVYSPGAADQDISPGAWDTVFSNTEVADCPISQCQISDAGLCGSGTFSASSELTLSATSPWSVQASTSNPDGYQHSICIRCENGQAFIDLDNWTISQLHRCEKVFHSNELSYSNVSLAYNADVEFKVVQTSTNHLSWDEFFGNTDSVNCPINECLMYNEGACGTEPYEGSNLQIQTESPWNVLANLWNQTGYVERVCIQCKNGHASTEFDGWTISQAIAPLIPNIAPFFATDPESQLYDVSSPDDLFTYILPEIIDEHPLLVSLSISQGFNDEIMTFENQQITFTNISETSEYTLKYILQDQEGLTKSYNQVISFYYLGEEIVEEIQETQTNDATEIIVSSEIEVKESPQVNFQFDGWKSTKIKNQTEESQTVERQRLYLNVTDFRQNGEIDFKFSELFQSLDFFKLNQTFLNKKIKEVINVQYKCASGDQDQDQKYPSLADWKIQDFSSESLTLKLNFTNPLYVSSYGDRDIVNFHFIANNLFISQLDDFPLEENFHISNVLVPPQMKSQEDFQAIVSLGSGAQNSLLFSLIIPFLFMVFMSASMNRVWALYNLLQLISNLKNYLTLSIPGNAFFIIVIVSNISQFSILQEENVKKWLTRNVFSKTPYLVTIFIDQGVFVTSLIICAIMFFLVYIGLRVKKVQIICQKLKEKLMWSSVLRSQIQTFFPTCLAIFTSFKLLFDIGVNLTEIEKSFSNYLTTFVKLAILVGLPIFSFYHLKRNFIRILGFDENFAKAFGTLFQNVETSKTCVYQMNTIFCLRRLLVGFFTVFINKTLILNIYVNIYSSLWILKFYFKKRPMIKTRLNQMEILNEVFYLFSNYFMLLFTEYIGDVEFRYQIGNYLIIYVSLIFLVNLVIICYDMATDIHSQRKREIHDKKWKQFYEKRDEMIEFILREYKRQNPKDKTDHQELKRELEDNYSFDRLSKKVEKIFRKYQDRKQNIVNVIQVVETPRFKSLKSEQKQSIELQSLQSNGDDDALSDFTFDEEAMEMQLKQINDERNQKIDQIQLNNFDLFDEQCDKIHKIYDKKKQLLIQDMEDIRQYRIENPRIQLPNNFYSRAGLNDPSTPPTITKCRLNKSLLKKREQFSFQF